jgi:hypothetical protein
MGGIKITPLRGLDDLDKCVPWETVLASESGPVLFDGTVEGGRYRFLSYDFMANAVNEVVVTKNPSLVESGILKLGGQVLRYIFNAHDGAEYHVGVSKLMGAGLA